MRRHTWMLLIALLGLLVVATGCKKKERDEGSDAATTAAAGPQGAAPDEAAQATAPGAAPGETVDPDGPVYFQSTDPKYTVTLAAGEGDGGLVLTMVPGGAYKVNEAYPMRYELAAGTRFDKERFDVTPGQATLRLEDQAADAAGGTLKFSVCTPQRCELEEVVVRTGEGAAPAPTPDPAPDEGPTTL